MREALIGTALFCSMMVASVCEAGTCPKTKNPALTRAEAEQVALDHVGYEVEVRAADGAIHEIAIAVDDGSIVDVDVDFDD